MRYDTAEPLARRLQEILIKVPESAALSQFLPQLKGARISAKVSGEEFAGRVLGLEPFTESSDGRVVRQGHRLVILTDAGAMRSADLAGIAELAILDEGLRADVVRLLDLALEGRRADAKRLAVTASGKGERELRVGYLVEMPVWKCSYRLILDPEDKEKALLQGWAQAENTSGEDWENIAVSFVAGNPLSFSMDMYTPLFVPRPQVPVPGLQNLAVNWGGGAGARDARRGSRPSGGGRAAAHERKTARAPMPAAPAPAMAAGFAAQRMDKPLAEAAAEERATRRRCSRPAAARPRRASRSASSSATRRATRSASRAGRRRSCRSSRNASPAGACSSTRPRSRRGRSTPGSSRTTPT